MGKWENLISDAKKAYLRQSYDSAMLLNKEALALSINGFEHSFYTGDPEKAVASVLISYLNMIDVHIERNNLIAASVVFENILFFLQMANHRDYKTVEQRDAVMRGSRVLHHELVLFLKNYSSKLPNKDEKWLQRLPSQIASLYENTTYLH